MKDIIYYSPFRKNHKKVKYKKLDNMKIFDDKLLIIVISRNYYLIQKNKILKDDKLNHLYSLLSFIFIYKNQNYGTNTR